MRKYALIFLSLFFTAPAYAGIDKTIDEAFAPISEGVGRLVFVTIPFGQDLDVPVILILLAATSAFFTLYLGFVNFRLFGHAVGQLSGFLKKKEKGHGEITVFQALMTSLSGTVGLGNIAGVAVAISTGGPGAMFWMVIMGLLGMASKFAECTLGIKYRHEHEDGEVFGGPMYYLKEGFKKYGWPKVGLFLAGVFAICVMGGAIGGGNMFQSNQSFNMLVTVTGGPEVSPFAQYGWAFGLVLAVLVAAVIIGGIKSIARVSAAIVPAMAVIYLLAGCVVIAVNYPHIPGALSEIFSSAFNPKSVGGGLLGVLIIGIQRAAFSNEAGLGSAAIPYAAVKTNSPVSQGVVAMLGPFIDTVIICSMTALVIVISGVHAEGNGAIEGVDLTSRAFESVISWFPHVLALAVFLFAYSTIIAWFYYGLRGATYLFGESETVAWVYKVIYCLAVVIGAAANLTNVIGFTDAMILSMAFPNIIGLYVLAPELKKDLQDYIKTLRG